MGKSSMSAATIQDIATLKADIRYIKQGMDEVKVAWKEHLTNYIENSDRCRASTAKLEAELFFLKEKYEKERERDKALQENGTKKLIALIGAGATILSTIMTLLVTFLLRAVF